MPTPPQLLASSVHYRWKHSIVLSEIEFHRHANRQQESAIYNTWTKKHPVKHVRTYTGTANSHCTHSRHLPHFKNSSGIEPPHPQTALPQKYMRQLQPCTPTYTIECPYTAGSPADVWAGHYCIHTQYIYERTLIRVANQAANVCLAHVSTYVRITSPHQLLDTYTHIDILYNYVCAIMHLLSRLK